LTLTRSKVKVKVTGLVNFRQLAKPCMLAAMTAAPLRGFLVLKTYDHIFTLTTKKSLHIIFKAVKETQRIDPIQLSGLIHSSSATGLLMEGALLPLLQLQWQCQ